MADPNQVTHLHYSRSKRRLELTFSDGADYELSAEFLRVFSPSAEVRGHGPGQEVLQTGKSSVPSPALNPLDTTRADHLRRRPRLGLYSWRYLRDLAERQDHYWQQYLQQLSAAGQSRDPEVQVLHFDP